MTPIEQRTAVSKVKKRHRRSNRRTYVVEILLIFCSALLLKFIMTRLGVPNLWVDILMTIALLFFIARALAGRSHDYGRTDEWTLLLFTIFTGGWLVTLFWDAAHNAVEIVAYLAWIFALLVPVLFKGDEGRNQFGSPPQGTVELNVIANVG